MTIPTAATRKGKWGPITDHEGSNHPDKASQFLQALKTVMAGLDGLEFEYSCRLTPSQCQNAGRFTLWTTQMCEESINAVQRCLVLMGAPDTVCQQHFEASFPVRQGISIDTCGLSPNYRLYLHGLMDSRGKSCYRAWRWDDGGQVDEASYHFSFYPQSPQDELASNVVPDFFRETVIALEQNPLYQKLSGFWLRKNHCGHVSQVDLTFPWQPRLGELSGQEALLTHFNLPHDHHRALMAMRIRHIGFKCDGTQPVVTLYASAPASGPWPDSLATLQAQVQTEATVRSRQINAMLRPVSHLDGDSCETGQNAPDIGKFYDYPVTMWRQVLGAGLHYHAGLFEDGDEADDVAADAAWQRAVTQLYPLLPVRGRLYDIGCGWCGPLNMITKDCSLQGLGLTPSLTQYRYGSSLGLDLRLGDAEQTLPPGHFDCLLLLESFSHIKNKPGLLRQLQAFGDRLVMRVNCQDAAAASTTFGHTMFMISSAELKSMLEQCGWTIQHWRDRRMESLASIRVWHRRLAQIPPTPDPHLETLRAWTQRVLPCLDDWGRSNPLIEVMATRVK